MERKNRDFAVAVLSFIAILACADFRLFLGQVNSFGAPALPGYAFARHIWEMAYQEIPVRWTTADIIRAGYFPSWTPFPEAGTPLIGKMQNGIFYPFHILYYLASTHWRPWAFAAIPPLYQTFEFACLYLLARLLGLPLLLSILACAAVACATTGNQLSPNPVTALFLSVLLSLAELYHRDEKKRAFTLWLLPAITALAFFGGHFETAFRISAMAGLYFVIRSFRRPLKNGQRLKMALAFAGAQALGTALAAVQILPGMEYVRWSYNNVWRTRPEFSWAYQTIQKHLGLSDTPLLTLGLCAAGAAVWIFKKVMREKNPQKAGGWLIAGVAALGVCIATLARLGLDVTFDGLIHGEMFSYTMPGEFFVIFLFFLALTAVLCVDLDPALQALGVLFGLSTLVQLKTPPLSNILVSLPITKLFDNTQSTPELTLTMCLLAAAALSRWGKADIQKRKAVIGKMLLCLAMVAGGWAAADGITPLLTKMLPTAIYSAPGSNQNASFMGPESYKAFAGTTQSFQAEAPFSCVSAAMAVVSGGKVVSAGPAEILSSFGECSLYGILSLPAQPSGLYVLAKATLPDGSSRILQGPRLSTLEFPVWPLAAAAVAAPLSAIFPPAGAALYAASVGYWAHAQTPLPISPDEFPFHFPGVDKLKTDPSLFRISAFDPAFLEADYPNLYGISDIRNGGDNLDVLPAIYFDFLTQNLVSKPAGSPDQTAGLRLLGLANVKYLVAAPETAQPSPDLKKIYLGPDMAIYENALAMPRAAFFPSAVDAPISDIRDWDAGRRLAFGAIPQILQQPGFNPQQTLILNDPPGENPALAPILAKARIKSAAAQVLSYAPNRVVVRTQAPAAGYVFLADNYFPGWQAEVNGAPSPILRADLTFRAVQVPAGDDTVVFSYRPLALEIGAVVTGIGMVLWLTLFLLCGPDLRSAAAENSQDALNDWTAHMIWRMILGLVVPTMAFWALWGLFVFNGGIQKGFKRPAALFAPQPPLSAAPAPSAQQI